MLDVTGPLRPILTAERTALNFLGRLSGVAKDMSAGPPEVGISAMKNLLDYNPLRALAELVGAAGLVPTLEAARAGRRVLLANKEALVMSGRLLLEAVAASGASLLPIDSEHNAIFQCLPPGRPGLRAPGVRRVWLTASGGPFLRLPPEGLARVTPDEACAHPRWAMGRKISVDSATLMNKGLEVIEASWLFDFAPDRIDVVIHPQSVIHSMVEFCDGSIVAQKVAEGKDASFGYNALTGDYGDLIKMGVLVPKTRGDAPPARATTACWSAIVSPPLLGLVVDPGG